MANRGNAGVILGKAGSSKGNTVRLARLNGVRRYTKQGTDGHPSTVTKAGGVFALEFQWEPVHIAKLIDPAARFAAMWWPASTNYQVKEGVPILVMNAQAVFKGEKPSIRDAAFGSDAVSDKIFKWVEDNDEIANQIAVHSNIWRSVELIACLGFVEF